MVAEFGGLTSLKELTLLAEKRGIKRRTFKNYLRRLMNSRAPAIAISRSLTGKVIHFPDVMTDLELLCVLPAILSLTIMLLISLHSSFPGYPYNIFYQGAYAFSLISFIYRICLGRYIRHKYDLSVVTRKRNVLIEKYVTQKDGKKVCISINGRFKGNTTLSEIKKYACMKISKEYGIAINEGDHLIVKEKRPCEEDTPLYAICSYHTTFRLVSRRGFLEGVRKDLLEELTTSNELDLSEYSRRKGIPFHFVHEAAIQLEEAGDYEIKIRDGDDRMLLCKNGKREKEIGQELEDSEPKVTTLIVKSSE